MSVCVHSILHSFSVVRVIDIKYFHANSPHAYGPKRKPKSPSGKNAFPQRNRQGSKYSAKPINFLFLYFMHCAYYVTSRCIYSYILNNNKLHSNYFRYNPFKKYV